MSSPKVSSSSCLPACSFQAHDRASCSLITFVALLALGAIIIGVLGILASQTHLGGLGPMHQIGLPASAALVGFGGITGAALLALSCRCEPKSGKVKAPETDPVKPLPVSKNSLSYDRAINDYIQSELPRAPKLTFTVSEIEAHLQGGVHFDPTANDEETIQSFGQDVQAYSKWKLNCEKQQSELFSKYQRDLCEIYGTEDQIPLFCDYACLDVVYNDMRLREQFLLVMCPTERLLSLSWQEIADFSREQKLILLQRLARIDHFNPISSSGRDFSSQMDESKENLFRLLQMKDPELSVCIERHPELLPFLKPEQIAILIQKESYMHLEQILDLLPIDHAIEKIETKNKLSQLSSNQELHPFLLQLPLSHLILLPPKVRSKIVWTPVRLQQSIVGERQVVQEFIESCPISVIQAVASRLQVDFLHLFSKAHLQHKDFPWTTFLNKPGAHAILKERHVQLQQTQPKPAVHGRVRGRGRGDAVSHESRREDRSIYVSRAHISWDQIYTVVLEQLFDSKTGPFFAGLKALEVSTIAAFPDILKVDTLSQFSEEQLVNSHFPWQSYIHKKGIGGQLRAIYQRFHRIFLHEGCTIPLSSLSDEERIAFFKDDNEGRLLAALSIGYLTQIAPKLSVEQYRLLLAKNATIFLHEDFPWSALFTIKGIGAFIAELITKQIPTKETNVVRYKHFYDLEIPLPWDQLPLEEVQSVFDVRSGYQYAKQQMMKKIPLDVFKKWCKQDTPFFASLIENNHASSWYTEEQQAFFATFIITGE